VDLVNEDKVFYPIMLEAASCLCQQISAAGLPEPCFCGVLAGATVVLDYCGDCGGGRCGQAWVRLSESYGSTTFPDPAVNPTCAAPLAAVLEFGIARCAPVGDDQGNPPSLGDQLDTARLVTADMQAIRRAIACCMGHREHVLGSYTPLGPVGGCVGGTWPVTVSEDF
jgi:hypothetical protein